MSCRVQGLGFYIIALGCLCSPDGLTGQDPTPKRLEAYLARLSTDILEIFLGLGVLSPQLLVSQDWSSLSCMIQDDLYDFGGELGSSPGYGKPTIRTGNILYPL